MKFGAGFFPTAEAMPPGSLGRLLEERGHESLFFAEHTHIPASRLSSYPAGGELPPKYARTYDPFVAATAVAAATARLRIGTGICLVTERDPIITAKEVASLMAERVDPAKLEELAELGVSRAVHWLPSAKRSAVEPGLERWEKAIAELYGEA